jgi:hypothetical protein
VANQAWLAGQDDLAGQTFAEGEGAARQLLPILDLPDHLDGLTSRVKQAQEEDGGVHLTRDRLVEKTAKLNQVAGSKQAAVRRRYADGSGTRSKPTRRGSLPQGCRARIRCVCGPLRSCLTHHCSIQRLSGT